MSYVEKTHRFGLLTPSSNTVQEPEFSAALPPTVSLHTGRSPSCTTVRSSRTVSAALVQPPCVPAKAGTQGHSPRPLDSRLRGNERGLGGETGMIDDVT